MTRDQATIRISVQLDDFKQPIGVVMPLSKLDPSLTPIFWNVWESGSDTVVYREPANMWRENAQMIVRERELVSKKLVNELIKAISKAADEETVTGSLGHAAKCECCNGTRRGPRNSNFAGMPCPLCTPSASETNGREG